MTVLAAVTTVELLDAVARVAGLAAAAGVLAGLTAFVFRWYAGQRVPTGLAVLVGLAGIAAYLNTRTALGEVIGDAAAISIRAALFNVAAFGAGALASGAGQRLGDRLADDVFTPARESSIDDGVSRVVSAVGRVITVKLPAEINDIVGYDPVDADTKEKLAGRTFIFPRRLTVAELRERLVSRLKTDYGVGHVDIDLKPDGTVPYLALGRRAAGIGPTLPPESAAIAVRADPAYAASAGDVVQVWTRDGSERLCNAEVRGTAGEIVTLAIDAADTTAFDREATYRLVTLSVDARPDREFASLLRAADETLGVITVGAGSLLDGAPLGAVDVTVVAVAPVGADRRVTTLPGRNYVLEDGESLYALGTPEALRRVEAAAEARPDRLADTADGGTPAVGATEPGEAVVEEVGVPGEDGVSSDIDAGTESDADARIESDADTGSESDVDIEAGSKSDADTGSESDAEAGSKNDAEAGSESDAEAGSESEVDDDETPDEDAAVDGDDASDTGEKTVLDWDETLGGSGDGEPAPEDGDAAEEERADER